ncbi:molybdenum cofactor guanylyltransferase [Oleiharenicola lentus]|uniref:molybdenum cofactor guanylyltransferase n=1 Tax=Oleiharenicola lentus TaxID=2508720 RepID=UPI003F66E2F3
MSFATVLLTGGGSRRMGRDKAMLAWSDGTLLTHQAATLRATGASELLLSCAPDREWICEGFRVVCDTQADTGPAAALLDAWQATTADVLVVLPIDVPRMSVDYLRELALRARQLEQSVVPVRGGYFEPLAAAWHRSSLVAFDRVAHRPMQEICAELAKRGLLHAREVSDGEAALFENMNTPEEYQRVRDARRLELGDGR